MSAHQHEIGGNFITAILRALIAAFVVTLAIPVHAEPGSSTAPGEAQAVIVEPLSVNPLADLSFGRISVLAGQSGSVIVEPDGAATVYQGGVRSACAGNEACMAHPARFSAKGEAGRNYQIAVPQQIQTLATQGRGTSLPISVLVVQTESLPNHSATGRLDSDGEDSFKIGGTLQVPVGTPSDTYQAIIPVIVNYN